MVDLPRRRAAAVAIGNMPYADRHEFIRPLCDDPNDFVRKSAVCCPAGFATAEASVIGLKPDYALGFSNRCRARNGKGDYDRAIGDCDGTIVTLPLLQAPGTSAISSGSAS